MQTAHLTQLATLIRSYILRSTTAAGSGHPTSSLSATDLMTTLMFGGFFRYDLKDPENRTNDRLIFSKGHASPLFYALWAAAGGLPLDELLTLRQFESRLEGHPTRAFPFTEVPTGSLGQGLSIGVGMALNARLDNLPYKTYVVLGDGEMAEGQNWEALQIAAYYKLNNLIGIIDVSCLEQVGETMYCRGSDGHGGPAVLERVRAFGWHTILVDGHDYEAIGKALKEAQHVEDTPVMLVAPTIKGKGVSFLEAQNNWHGKALSQEQLHMALAELGSVDETVRGSFVKPLAFAQGVEKKSLAASGGTAALLDGPLSPRKAYGQTLVALGQKHPDLVVLDAGVSNSTFAETFKQAYPDRFFEMFIAEQNMVSVALGLARRGKKVVASTFGAFFSRAFDQLRMAAYAGVPLVLAGTHVGVSIGQDGVSQMGLEDIALFRSLWQSTVLYPADARATQALVAAALENDAGMTYVRLTRAELPRLYGPTESFKIGGSKVLHAGKNDQVTLVAAGITVFEALHAAHALAKEKIHVRVIDCYSVKPIDEETLRTAAHETKALLVIEDHYPEGGLAEAVRSGLAGSGSKTPIYSLAVRKLPRSGRPEELVIYEEIDARTIIKKVKEILGKKSGSGWW